MLQGVLDSARSLTSARYGVVTLLDDGGRVQDFLSSGTTAAEAERLWHTPEGREIFERLGGVSEPLRIPDLVGYVRSLGFADFSLPLPAEPASPFLASQMFHGSERVGNIFLAGRGDGREFSPEDEQTLVMFTSQAALVIANARTHREERRARTDLETLIGTSPVGVVVFDARTAGMASFNREARRIVDGLRNPGQGPEDLLELMTIRRADGSEVSLQEFPLARLLGDTETLRAEEIVLGVPDGRSVTVLLNATPILSEQGTVESVVVTMQDMADVEELERLRAEFLAMVSHELRAPLAAVKGSVATLMESAGELDPAVGRQFFRLIEERVDHMHGLVSDLLDVARIETGTLAVGPEPTEVTLLLERARSAFTGAGGRNNLAIDLEPDLPPVMADRRRIVQVLGNLLANAARHSAESSVIRVNALLEELHVAFSVADEGRGIPAESLPHLFRKFSRAQSEEQGGDTGLGLAICKGIVEAHGGRIRVESDGPGLGARFTFTLPTVAERPALVLLDLMLPGADGIELMREILDAADVPVIGRDELIATAFGMGAADYVVGDLTIDYTQRRVTLAGEPVDLLPMEYRLLAELSFSAGRTLTYEHLLDRVWRERSGDDLRPMRTIVRKLRRKLGDDAANPTCIFTERRVGYRMPRGRTRERGQRSLEADGSIRERRRYPPACMTTRPPSRTWMLRSCSSSNRIPTRGVASAA